MGTQAVAREAKEREELEAEERRKREQPESFYSFAEIQAEWAAVQQKRSKSGEK